MAAGNEVRLTPTEYNLLQELVLNAGKVLSHDHLLRRVWGPEYGQEREYLHVFVGRLRAKLEPDPAKPRYIITVSGVGYRFEHIS
jgi:two-component system KDP operon response regulator KdpE